MAHVVVQMGHCYRTTGSTGTAGEQKFNELAAELAVFELERRGHRGRAVKADVEPGEYRGDVFVAIHCDGSTSPSARGASVGYQSTSGQRIAVLWKRAYHRRGWGGGFRPDNYTPALAGYYGVSNARAAGARFAFIVESGFLTSPDDRAQLSGPGGARRVGLAIADAVDAVLPLDVEDELKLPRLHRGDQGPAVVALKALLRARGHRGFRDSDRFGGATEAAVLAFKADHPKLTNERTGVVGGRVWRCLITRDDA